MIKRILTALLLVMLGSVGNASDFPNRPVRIVTALPAGSSPDVIAKNLADELQKKWNVPVIVENRPGGQGLIALRHFHQQTKDGYTLYFAGGENIVQVPILFQQNQLVTNLVPVAPISAAYFVLFSSSDIKDYNTLVKKIQNKPLYGSWGIGTFGHVLSLEYSQTIGVNATHLPYKEFGPWLVDISNKDVSYGFGSIGSTIGFQREGKIRYFAITRSQRDPQFPDVPTYAEVTGQSPSTASGMIGMFVDKQVDANIRHRLEKDIMLVMQNKRMKDVLALFFHEPANISLTQYVQNIQRERTLFTDFVRRHNIPLQ